MLNSYLFVEGASTPTQQLIAGRASGGAGGLKELAADHLVLTSFT
jgi:hypothetical protein